MQQVTFFKVMPVSAPPESNGVFVCKVKSREETYYKSLEFFAWGWIRDSEDEIILEWLEEITLYNPLPGHYTEQEKALQEVVSEAFEAGYNKHEQNDEMYVTNQLPDKTEYINKLLNQ